MYFLKNDFPDRIKLRIYKDFQFTFCHNHYEFGILIHAKGRTYHVQSFDTSDCDTYFKFRNKRFFTHQVDKVEEIPPPEWLKLWVKKNVFTNKA